MISVSSPMIRVWGLGFSGLGFRVIKMENQMEKKIENDVETEIMWWIIQGLGF